MFMNGLTISLFAKYTETDLCSFQMSVSIVYVSIITIVQVFLSISMQIHMYFLVLRYFLSSFRYT